MVDPHSPLVPSCVISKNECSKFSNTVLMSVSVIVLCVQGKMLFCSFDSMLESNF